MADRRLIDPTRLRNNRFGVSPIHAFMVAQNAEAVQRGRMRHSRLLFLPTEAALAMDIARPTGKRFSLP
jgi:hypothetical protein